jgi:hypothetical protein
MVLSRECLRVGGKRQHAAEDYQQCDDDDETPRIVHERDAVAG